MEGVILKRGVYMRFEQCFSVVADKSSLWPAPTAVQSIYKEICLGYIEQIIYPLQNLLESYIRSGYLKFGYNEENNRLPIAFHYKWTRL